MSGWDGSPLVWTLFGRTATAGLSKECAPPAADDSVAPTVELVSPAESSTVWSSITVSATASDDGGVDRVELLVDGETVASDTDAPYDLEFDTTTVDDGAHEIGVRAVDVSGNEATDAVSIVVGNALPGPARLDADFESGRIDAETYVLEATRAVFGDPDVAARYGDAPVVADPPSAWYWEVLTLVETLDPAAQQELREYLTLTVEPQDTAPSTSDLQSSGTDEPESAASALSSTSESPPAIDDRGCVAILYRIASGYVGGDCWVVVGDVDLWWDSGDFTAADFAPGDALPRNVRRYAEGFRDAQSTFEGTGPEELAYPDAGEVDVIVDGDRSTVRGVSLPNVLGLGQRILVPTNPTQPEYLAAHELFHQHQWDYAPPAIVWRPGGVREGARWWMEASAQWAAHQVQVDHGYDIEDFDRYFTTLQAFYDDASSELYRTDDFRREYGGFVVAEWLHHRAAAVSQERPADIVKRVWELVDPSTLPTAAFAQVLPGASPVFDRRQIAGMWEDLYFLYFLDVPIPGRVTQDVTDRWREGLSQSGAPFQEARGPVSWSAPIDVGETLERQFTLGGAGAAVIEVAPREVGALTVTVDAGADVETRSFPLSDYDVDPRAGAATCTYVDPEEDNRSSTTRYPVWDPGRCEGLVVIVSNATDAASSRVPVTVGVSLSAATDAVISNGTVELGVNAEGHLIVPGRRESSQKGTNALGLRYVPENNEAVSAGCYCEAWGSLRPMGSAPPAHGRARTTSGGPSGSSSRRRSGARPAESARFSPTTSSASGTSSHPRRRPTTCTGSTRPSRTRGRCSGRSSPRGTGG